VALKIGVDVGGTFTDFVMVRPGGKITIHKTATTPADQSIGFLNGLGELAEMEERSLDSFLGAVDVIVHGTTTADNTMITLSGARTGLITTQGHRDELELRRGFKESIWDPAIPPPPPICPRRSRLGVRERLDFEGNVVIPLDEDEVRTSIRRLKRQGVESLAIAFLFSFVNPAHERRAAEIAREEWPEVRLSLSHEVMPAAPEFERTSTTVVNAYVAPKIATYVGRLEERLAEHGFRGRLLIMQSNGGVMTPEYVARRAVAVLGSGPAGGVIAATRVAARAGVTGLVAGDMGGTSFDVCLVRDGKPRIQSGWNWHHRYLVGLPMVDVESIGAGGGSIAHVEAGALKVGPKSAGADPGPICYGRGGTEPTVTDANLVLGYLDPEGFCGGAFRLQRDGVDEAIERAVGRPLGLELAEAANGIFRVVNASMAHAIRRVSAKRGVDPRELTLVAYGGNGPLHAGMQAEELGIRDVLVPRSAPAFSALGLLLTDHVLDEMRAYITPAGKIDPERVAELFAEMEASARVALPRKKGAKLAIERFALLCYPGQTFEMPVPFVANGRRLGAREIAATIERFHELHEELHTYAAREEEPILRGLRLQATIETDKPSLPKASAARSPLRTAVKGKRRAYFGGRFTQVPVYDGSRLGPGHSLAGPAIVEERFTTIVVFPGQRMAIDPRGNYRISL
jgi:N-methylhydantoinase A